MSNDIDTLSAGEIAPYNPGSLAERPFAPDFGGRTDLYEYQQAPQSRGPAFFGAALPAGTTQQQADAVLGQLGAAFMNDFSQLGYPANYVQAAISFMQENATKPMYHVQPNHSINLFGHDDWLGNAFANMVNQLPGSQQAKQQFVKACLQWLAKATQQLSKGTEAQAPSTQAPTEDQTANLTDRQYQQLIAHNEAVKVQTMAALERKWGACFKANIELANAQLNKLTPPEFNHLNRYTGNWPWTHMLNTVECITFLFDSAIGAGSIGTSGADIAREIASFEAMLKIPSERAKYMRDPAMQTRLRELYARRG